MLPGPGPRVGAPRRRGWRKTEGVQAFWVALLVSLVFLVGYWGIGGSPRDSPTGFSGELEEVEVPMGGAPRGEGKDGGVAQTFPPKGLYALEAVGIDGKVVSLSKFAGTVSLVVNVASQCSYTPDNYKGLQGLQQRYEKYGFNVLAFPCNQFGKQEPGSAGSIETFARTQYGVTFPLFSKVDVKIGGDQSPVFAWLLENSPAGTAGDVGWNFEKWLVGRDGETVLHRYGSGWDEMAIAQDVADAVGVGGARKAFVNGGETAPPDASGPPDDDYYSYGESVDRWDLTND